MGSLHPSASPREFPQSTYRIGRTVAPELSFRAYLEWRTRSSALFQRGADALPLPDIPFVIPAKAGIQ
jgi:hypothetical protein